MSKLECWSFIISWSFDIWFIPLTQLTVEVWPEGFFKSWFKPFTASSWKTLFFTWSEKLLFLITSVPVINLSTWALIKFGDEATSLLEEEYSRHVLRYIKLTLPYSSHSSHSSHQGYWNLNFLLSFCLALQYIILTILLWKLKGCQYFIEALLIVLKRYFFEL